MASVQASENSTDEVGLPITGHLSWRRCSDVLSSSSSRRGCLSCDHGLSEVYGSSLSVSLRSWQPLLISEPQQPWQVSASVDSSEDLGPSSSCVLTKLYPWGPEHRMACVPWYLDPT